MKIKSCLLVLGCAGVLTVNAAEYPAELRGKWGTGAQGAYCPALEIDKKFAVMGTEQTCQAATVKSSGPGVFLIKEKCSGEGGDFTESTLYTMTADGFIDIMQFDRQARESMPMLDQLFENAVLPAFDIDLHEDVGLNAGLLLDLGHHGRQGRKAGYSIQPDIAPVVAAIPAEKYRVVDKCTEAAGYRKWIQAYQ